MTRQELITHNAEETMRLGEAIGKQLQGGEVIRLIGDVGAGKTTFVRGLVKGIESTDHVSSPTFTVYKVYRGRVILYHYDFYRVQDDPAIANELSEVMQDPKVSLVLEWPEFSRAKMVVKTLDIGIITGDREQRKLQITVPKEISYIKLP